MKMETKYKKADFQLKPHRVYNNDEYLVFNNPNITHRYGGLVHNNKIGIKGDTCNRAFEKCNFLSRLDCCVRFINYSLNNNKNHFHTDNTIIQFDTIVEANHWFNSIYDFIVTNDFNNYSTFLNGKKLPKGIIMLEQSRVFKFFKINNDFTLTEYDFELEYNKSYKHTENDLFKCNFDTMKYEQNLACKTWV